MNVLRGEQQFVFSNKKPESQTLNMLDYFDAMSWQSDKEKKSSGPSADVHILGDMQLILLVWDLLQLGQRSVSVTWAWTFTSCPSPARQVSWGKLPNVSENQLPSLWNRNKIMV